MDLLLALQHASLNPIRRPILLIEESDALEYLQQQGEGSDENAIADNSAIRGVSRLATQTPIPLNKGELVVFSQAKK